MDLRNWFDERQIACKSIFRNSSVPELYEVTLQRGEGKLGSNGALMVYTGKRTGRSPEDRFIVKDEFSKDGVDWNKINIPTTEDVYSHLYNKIREFLKDKDVYVFDGFVGADERYRIKIRVIAEKPWHALFARTLFLRPTPEQLANFGEPDFCVYACGGLKLEGEKDKVRSDTAIILNLKEQNILICGSEYGGEIKKSLFTVMNFLMPERNIMPMHCSANVGKEGDCAIFFGLSGTGKTTLSADPDRYLIGDDEHGWSEDGIFNFEGGCYAKIIKLRKESEPLIYNAIRFGSIAENVVYDPQTREIDFDNGSITENTRTTYPVDFIPNIVLSGKTGHPKNIFFLTADAFGVLPPVSKLTPEGAIYHFLSGYTAKLAGTEVGVIEPQATFSTCFGAPFMIRSPWVYARLLAEKMKKHSADCWLINTGWTGGPYGVGKRMSIELTRSILSSVLEGKLKNAKFIKLDKLNLMVPEKIEGLEDQKVLIPEHTWQDKNAYQQKMEHLISLFVKNFERFKAQADSVVLNAAPSL